MTRDSFTAWSKEYISVALQSSHRDWETGALSSFMIMFQRNGSQVPERQFWVIKLAREFLKDLHLKEEEKEFTSFSKENALRKQRGGTQDHEETYLKFSQAEGNVKALIVII